jgi:hypothetical protein
VTGRVGEQDLKRGEVVTKSPRRTGGKPYEVLRGNFFNDDFWDGNDFCLSGYGGYPIVTKRVVDTLKKKRIENVRFVPVSEDEVGLDILKLAGQWPLGSKKDG